MVSKTCFLIDDDKDDHELFAKALQEIHPALNHISAFDGAEALQKLSEAPHSKPDYIFLDLNMPGMNGRDFLYEIKKLDDFRHIPVIIYTTSSSENDKVDTKRLGAYDYITKPYQHDALVNVLSEFIKRIDARNFSQQVNEDVSKPEPDILKDIPDGVLSFDKDWNFIYSNNEGAKILGKSPQDLLGKNLWAEFPELVLTSFGKLYMQAMEDGQFKEYEDYYAPFETWFNVRVYPIPAGLLLLFQNINERKEKEKALKESRNYYQKLADVQKDLAQALLDASVDYICVVDPELKLLLFNKACAEVFGLEADMIGKRIIDVYPQLSNSPTHNNILKALNGEPTYNFKHSSVVVDKHFESFFVPLKNQGHIYAVMTLHHDITELINTAEKLAEANMTLAQKNKELEDSNYELEQFAFIASHDLQEPLRKIQSFADFLEKSLGDEGKSKFYLKKVVSSSQRMSELIQDILNYSKLSKSDEKFEKVDLTQVIEDVKQDFELLIEQRNVAMIHNDLPVVNGNALQLKQLFSNLFSNAIKFCLQDPIIEITSEKVTQFKMDGDLHTSDSYYSITVKDNGIGFDQQYAEKIFTVFQRLNGRHEFSGTGIGLAICKKIAENHHGYIVACSQPGEGACFTVFFPLTNP